MTAIRIVSVGYEKRSIDELVDLLSADNVNKLLDIRLTPISRHKGFSKKALASHLDTVGIEYVHIRSAGNPYHKQKNDIDMCLELYSGYLNKHRSCSFSYKCVTGFHINQILIRFNMTVSIAFIG